MHRRAMPRLMAARTTSIGWGYPINQLYQGYYMLLTLLLIWLLTMAIKWLLDVIIPLLLYGLCYGFDAS